PWGCFAFRWKLTVKVIEIPRHSKLVDLFHIFEERVILLLMHKAFCLIIMKNVKRWNDILCHWHEHNKEEESHDMSRHQLAGTKV
nr:hypothetical protein [Tanacetum cinerariifolium]